MVTLPCGLDANGLPFGIQLVGRMYEERDLLGVAIALEQAFAQDDELCAPGVDPDWLAGQDANCVIDGKQVQARFAGKSFS